MNKVEITGLVKYYGEFCAVNNVSFSFSRGKLTALCGRNGSGKTTSIRCLLDLLQGDEGEVRIDGLAQKLDPKKVGYLGEQRGLFIKEKVGFQLEMFAKLKGMNKHESKEAVAYWLNYFDVSSYRNKKLDSLSKGNQQKIQLIAALVHDPDIIILDEPFSGLDPINMQIFIDLIHELKLKGKLILVSSHQLTLIEGICEDICVIDQGKCIFSGSIIDLAKQYSSDYLFFVTKDKVDMFEDLEEWIPNNYRLKLDSVDAYNEKYNILMASGIEVETVGRKKLNLQEIFVEMVGNKNKREEVISQVEVK